MNCYKCGAALPSGAKFCHKCGCRLLPEARSELHETARPSPALAEPVGAAITLASQGDTATPSAQRPAQEGRSRLRAWLFCGGAGLIALSFVADFFFRRSYYYAHAERVAEAVCWVAILLGLWYAAASALTLNKPLTRRGPQVYWGGSVVVALLAGFVPVFGAATATMADKQIDMAFRVVAYGGALMLGLWALLHWSWFMARHWLVKLVLGPLLVPLLAVPARAVAVIGGFATLLLGGFAAGWRGWW